jgi:FtsP/CotA-like multicopper oxidase with cupredoxin domain
MMTLPAAAQSFRVQCPDSTITHPNPHPSTNPTVNNTEPAYTGPTTFTSTSSKDTNGYPVNGYLVPSAKINGAIKCQQISGGDGYATMADGTQTYMFSFGPLSGLADMANGQAGTEFPNVFNTVYPGILQPGDPTTSDGVAANTWGSWSGASPLLSTAAFNYNGAVGLAPDPEVSANPQCAAANPPDYCLSASPNYRLDGHVDPRQIEDIGVMNGNIPAPLMAIDEDDEFFLTLTNVGMIMRPDLFEQHTVHFHGYPNASSFYDGVPDASIAINIGGSFTYYYLAPDAGTYFWHCHITPPEHLQMGMVGQIYVRPRQNRVPQDGATTLRASLQLQETDLRTACNSGADILCSNPLPAVDTGEKHSSNASGKPTMYAYNDGDGSTAYDVEYAIQIHGFDPNFHFVGMTFNPEGFVDMKDKYFLLNGRSYPDTVTPGPLATQSSDGRMHFSQPLPSIVNIPAGGRALLRLSDLDVVEMQTLASLGIPMTEIALNAKLLRDQAGNNLAFKTNSITLGGGESLDVILDACKARAADGTCPNGQSYTVGQKFYLYTPNLDHLSNDAENFGGLMTEVNICGSVDPTTRACGT